MQCHAGLSSYAVRRGVLFREHAHAVLDVHQRVISLLDHQLPLPSDPAEPLARRPDSHIFLQWSGSFDPAASHSAVMAADRQCGGSQASARESYTHPLERASSTVSPQLQDDMRAGTSVPARATSPYAASSMTTISKVHDRPRLAFDGLFLITSPLLFPSSSGMLV
ncbi:hypothetical protein DL771_002772 [Monosporascus sp. 5C6A]|nr:hypothetical protein DL771_002772 [Monosporascus sp. 5C6A]